MSPIRLCDAVFVFGWLVFIFQTFFYYDSQQEIQSVPPQYDTYIPKSHCIKQNPEGLWEK